MNVIKLFDGEVANGTHTVSIADVSTENMNAITLGLLTTAGTKSATVTWAGTVGTDADIAASDVTWDTIVAQATSVDGHTTIALGDTSPAFHKYTHIRATISSWVSGTLTGYVVL